MKRTFNYFFIFVLLSGVFLVSCDEEGGLNLGGPTMTIIVDPADDAGVITGGSGEEIEFEVSVTANDGFNVFRVRERVGGTSDILFERTRQTAGVTSFDTTFTYTLQPEFIDQDVSLTLEAVDDAGETTTEVFTIDVTATVVSYTAVLLFPPTADEKSKTFFSTVTGLTYSVDDVEAGTGINSSEIDFGYYYGSDREASILSPAQFPQQDIGPNYLLADWDQLNQTVLKLTDITLAEFQENDENVSFIQQAFDDAIAVGSDQIVPNLEVDDIIAFQLDEDRGEARGLIRVIGIISGTGVNDSIEIEVVVIK